MKIGIIGCGLIGKKRVEALKNKHEIKIVADIKKNLADELAAKTDAKSSANWQDVVNADVDLVIIATTHDQLANISLQALKAGKHVLVEKPAGLNEAQLLPLITESEKRKLFVKVGFNHRFHPAFQQAYEIFKSGAIGEMMFVRGRYGHGGRIGYEKEWRCNQTVSGGGELIDQGSHLIDLSRWFMGDLQLDYAFTPTYFWDIKTDDNCFLALKAKNNQMAWLHATWTEWKNSFSFEIYGRNGKLAIEGLGGSYGAEKLYYHKMLPEMGPPETKLYEYNGPDNSWELEFNEFENAINEKRQPVGNIYDALQMHKIIADAYNFGNQTDLRRIKK